MGYTQKAVEGVGGNSFVKFALTVLTAIKIAILARILNPADFGLFALVAVAIGIIESVTETGINATIIQSEKSVAYFLDTAWVISIGRGLLISIMMMLLGLGMRWVYGSPQLFMLVGLASLIPFIKGFINPAVVTLQKDLRFYSDSLYRLLLTTVEVIATVLCGVLLRSVSAMVIGLIISAMFEVGLTFAMFQLRPRFVYLASRGQEIFYNMRGLNVVSVLGYLIENIDSLIVGKVIGTSGLGVYQNSYGLTHRMNLQLAKSVQHATFPVYAKIVNDRERVKKAFLKTLSSAMIGFFLISLPFFIAPGFSIHLLLGNKWNEAIPLVRPLLGAGLVQSIVSMAAALLIARKSYRWLNITMVINIIVMVPLLIVLGKQYGLSGAVYAVLISRCLALPAVLIGIWETLRLPAQTQTRSYPR